MPAPTRFGRYLLLERLAVGGMAEIFLAQVTGEAGFERTCVIKRVLPHLGRDPVFLRMFLDEARLAAKLHHPGIVQIHELGRVGADYFIAMEHLAGEDLAAVIAQARRIGCPVPVDVAAQLIAEAADALDWAHDFRDPRTGPLRIVHRDVSPSNLFLTFHGAVKVLDFGVARAEGRLSATEAGSTKGKLAYMSPEQALGREVDRRTDVWALGLCLRELLTGERLFSDGGAPFERVRRICEAPIPPPSSVRADVPPALDRIIGRALTREPEYRYPTAAALRADLLAHLAPQGPSADRLAGFLLHLYGEAHLRARTERVIEPDPSGPRTAPLGRTGSPPSSPVTRALDGPATPPADASVPTLPDVLPDGSQHELPPLDRSRWPNGRQTLAIFTGLLLVLGAAAWVKRPPLPSGVQAGMESSRLLATATPPPEDTRASAIGETPVTAMAASEAAPAQAVAPETTTPQTMAPETALPESAGFESGTPEAVAPETAASERARPDATDARPTDVATATMTPAAATKAPASGTSRTRRSSSRSDAGFLTVHANVPVEVFAGRKRLGKVPLEAVRLPAGRHRLRLVDAEKGLSQVRTIRISPGRTTVHRAVLGTGTLHVDAVPWAEVRVDGKPRGLTPLAGLSLWEGAHQVVLEGPEQTRTLTVRIRAGEVTSIREVLNPPSAAR